MLLSSNDASRNWISFLDEFRLQQQFSVPTHNSGGILDQVILSEEVEVSEPLVSFVTSSDHGVVHFDLLRMHGNLAVKKASCRKWQSFDVIAFAVFLLRSTEIILKIFGSVLMNEMSYVDKKHPLKTKYVNHTCPFFDDELRTMKRSRRKFKESFSKEW